ncbi:ribonuclease T2-like isoform X3 [Myxocyprinus asiaticus]|uniref:ribonuclease T2-like isoform X3 n=1 Tax=Myxocyprinus asiaticus TaxID=70543 RepID=UPI002223D53C|nr:ribonuclease T2-like isoform X3 [Myxocyprinus asiaticus]
MIYYKHMLWACTAALFTGWVLTYDQGLCSETVTRHSCNWTCMLLTLQWPGSFCISLNNKSICKIPQNIQNWTIHGLWPVHTGHCCDCWPIFHSHLQEIEPVLSQLWPSLLKGKNYFLFWREEWIKHGTCAGCEETMGSPVYYFQAAIKLRKLFDIDRWVLSGREAWIQLKFTLYRNQTLGCHKQEGQKFNTMSWLSSSGHPCPKNTTIFYFPINYEHPNEPCN